MQWWCLSLHYWSYCWSVVTALLAIISNGYDRAVLIKMMGHSYRTTVKSSGATNRSQAIRQVEMSGIIPSLLRKAVCQTENCDRWLQWSLYSDQQQTWYHVHSYCWWKWTQVIINWSFPSVSNVSSLKWSERDWLCVLWSMWVVLCVSCGIQAHSTSHDTHLTAEWEVSFDVKPRKALFLPREEHPIPTNLDTIGRCRTLTHMSVWSLSEVSKHRK